MANRSLQVKADRAQSQRLEAGRIEYSKPAYIDGNERRLSKSDLRAIAALVDPAMIKRAPRLTVVTREPDMVLYNPAIRRAPKTAAMAALVFCKDELVKRSDYRPR